MNGPRRLRLLQRDAATLPSVEVTAGSTKSVLVHAAKSGDVRAFAALVDAYYARCLRFAMHMLASRRDAEEAVQDTFVRVYKALPRYEEREAFDPWLFRILANRCRSAGSRERRHSEVVEYGEVPERPTPPGHDEAVAWREEIGLALASLPTEQR